MKIDSHLHFWHYHPVKDAWITDEMSVIKNDFLPADLLPLLEQQGITGGVAVQADQSEKETHFLMDLAAEYDFIKGVVGWVDFRAKNIEERLEYFSQFDILKGFRHIVQAEPDDDFLLRPDFLKGIAALSRHNFTYDVLIHPRHIPYAVDFVKRFPNQRFLVDHLAKPCIKDRLSDEWARELRAFAPVENVSCKMAGLVTEADWKNWKYDDFTKYIDITLEIFGTERVMFGSDWPVCLVGASYGEVCDIASKNTEQLSKSEQDKIWGENCRDFYSVKDKR
ncbi:amidohydrolase family protein [Dyadobacter sp. CY327]|uniref:amidohydrolase family protein n=1 Tax=Dyadobacter sp. CY327 TaxID=2907301 RepID=UPI001F35EEB0|nr:amidohydrolase family protein [Dyadobacter sp. CY327]MCE7070838.1 amidohydrolase family protein [Dyadobacter sp. CY327]